MQQLERSVSEHIELRSEAAPLPPPPSLRAQALFLKEPTPPGFVEPDEALTAWSSLLQARHEAEAAGGDA